MKTLVLGLFLPHSAMAIGQGTTAPIIALLALEMGASVPGAGLIIAMFGLGAFLADVPGGVLGSRIGNRRAMMLATGVMALSALGVASRPPLIVFAALVATMGASTAVFGIGRLAFATEISPIDRRGRVMSSIGGTQRIGLFIGPILGGLTIPALGLTGPYLMHAVMAFIAFVTVIAFKDVDHVALAPNTPVLEGAGARPRLLDVVRDHRQTFITAGAASVTIQIVRSARLALIPLWGDRIGLAPGQIAILFSLSAGMEVLMFYPIGRLMDRRGRKWVAIPSLTLMSLGLAAIPLTSDVLSLSAVAAFLGFANGMSSGINMTLSSDFSPKSGRSMFLGVWRMIADAGTASGPTIVAIISAFGGLALASVTVATAGLGGVILLWRAVPETLKRNKP